MVATAADEMRVSGAAPVIDHEIERTELRQRLADEG